MSNKKRRNGKTAFVNTKSELSASVSQINAIDEAKHNKSSSSKVKDSIKQAERISLFSYLRSNLWIVAVIGFLALGALGAGLKYLDEDAKRETAKRADNKSRLSKGEESFLNKINPFLPAPNPSSTPQLSKEYLYAGSRLLAVEDANANLAPPADLAIWRPSNGEWWIMGSAGGLQQVTFQWGMSGDKAVPGDYDGDGKTDFSVWRPSNGTWYIVNSGGGGGQFAFGQTGDLPSPADYDGDGRTDAAVYRGGTWYILRSSDNQTVSTQFGLSADIPAPADYDGDGRADIGVWRSSQTAFYSLNSSNNGLQIQTFGYAGNNVVSGDYDGDGKADYAVYNSPTANWYIRQSTNGQIVGYQWGTAGDKAVQNDYDGDGKVDIAVWKDVNGTWTIRNSSNPSQPRTEVWGMTNDIPVPAYYRR